MLPKDPTRVVVFFNEKFQIEVLKFISELFGYPQVAAMIDIRFAARKAKDEFLFVMKAFNAKKEIRSSAVIHKIERVEHEEENFNFLLEIESLKDDLKKLGLINQRNVAEKRTYFEESKRLEQEIEQIIVSYTTLIEGKFRTKKEFEQSFIDFESKKDEAISHKYRKIEQENERLKTKLNKILSN